MWEKDTSCARLDEQTVPGMNRRGLCSWIREAASGPGAAGQSWGNGQIMNGLQSSELEAARARASARVAPCWMPCRSEGAEGSTTASRTQGSGGSIQDLE